MRKRLIESHNVAPIEELTGKSWRVKIIEGDVQGSSAYYPKEVLEAQSDIVEQGTKIYLDHPSLDEAETRPERSAKDIIGYFKTGSTYENNSLFAEAEIFSDWQDWVKERAAAGVIGMSIRASGEVSESDGVPTLKKFDRVFSVDLVTEAGAKGGFEELLEADRNNEKEDILEIPKELLEALDAQAKEQKALAEAVAGLIASLTPEKPAVEESAEVDALAVAEQLAEAGLTKEGRTRVLEAHKAGADLAEAIASEKAYVESIAESARQENGFEANLEESGSKDSFSASATIFNIK